MRLVAVWYADDFLLRLWVRGVYYQYTRRSTVRTLWGAAMDGVL